MDRVIDGRDRMQQEQSVAESKYEYFCRLASRRDDAKVLRGAELIKAMRLFGIDPMRRFDPLILLDPFTHE